MKQILVLRLSSMGDVLLTLPVIKGVLDRNPDVELIFVTRKKFAPYFTGIDRLTVLSFDPETAHRGFRGLYRLYRETRRYRIARVVDLHGIIRTNILDVIFILTGYPVDRIDKHRKLRRKIVKHKELDKSVPSTVTRYLKVFEKAGLTGEISGSVFRQELENQGSGMTDHQVKRIGIAPISKHSTKNWGLQNIGELIQLLRVKHPFEFHLFGGTEDFTSLNTLVGGDVFNHAGILGPMEEISLIRKMDVFITMDSANMHLASLAGIATVSLWGATDPRLGFAPWNQPGEYAIYSNPKVVECRPCSVFGEIPCRRKDAPMICMDSIRPPQVFDKIIEILFPA